MVLGVVAGAWAVAQDGSPDFYVSSDGDDANPGTSSQPFATLRAARDAVRSELVGGIDEEIVVEIAGGRYPIREAITFGPEDSGTEEHRVVYRAAPNETPRFTGGRRITGWEEREDGNWSTTLPAVKRGEWTFGELFVAGKRAPPARYPDGGYLRVEEVGEDRRTNFTFYDGDIPAGADDDQLSLVFLHDWSISRIPVGSIDRGEDRLTAAHPVGPSASHYEMGHYLDHPRYFLTGDADFVDRPGEWFLDEDTGELIYAPEEGQRPDRVSTVAPVAGPLLEVRGRPNQPVRNLHFEGLTFKHSRYPMPENGYAAGQATGHEDRTAGGSGRVFVDAALTFENARACSFTDGRLAHLGGGGIWFKSRCDECRLIGSVIEDTGGNGVMIGTGGQNPEHMATGALVVNNRIRRPGQRFFGAVAIWAGIVRRTRIVHNEVARTPYTGISLGWQWDPSPTPAEGNTISYNHIHHVMQTLSDGGGIYTLGWHPDSALRGNYIHHVPEAAGRAESNGMFLDQGTKGFAIEHNVIQSTHHAPLRFHQAHANLVRLNVMTLRSDEVPRIRYNATQEHLITKRNNRLIDQAVWSPSTARHRIDEAGPKPGYLNERGFAP